MRGRLRDLTMNRDRTQNITVTVTADFRDQFDQLQDKDLDIEIRQHREKRSQDANSFCWALCTQIGNAIYPPKPKEEVYKEAIRDVGEYEPLPIRDEAVETFQRRWAAKGTGYRMYHLQVGDRKKRRHLHRKAMRYPPAADDQIP